MMNMLTLITSIPDFIKEEEEEFILRKVCPSNSLQRRTGTLAD